MTACPVFRPDHNGECLACDEWMDAHTPEAIAAGEQLAAQLAQQPALSDDERRRLVEYFRILAEWAAAVRQLPAKEQP